MQADQGLKSEAQRSNKMKRYYINMTKALSCALLLAPAFAFAFDSGSTGADGAFSPTVNTILELPPTGIFNFTSVNIPVGVTVTFKRNATNTPAVILSSTNITIAGTLNASGTGSTHTGAAGDGNLGDDGLPGLGGPGGFDGGRGGKAATLAGGSGLGPGGGTPGIGISPWPSSQPSGGGGGGFSGSGAHNLCTVNGGSLCAAGGGLGGASYGSSLLLPLIGGSGGGGGTGGSTFDASGGGGGGGAVLLAASGTVTVSGSILANGGASGSSSGGGSGATGGGGSGGAIRIIAGTIAGNGAITAAGAGVGSAAISGYSNGGGGAHGRIRLEADSITRTAATTPAFTTGAPGTVFVSGLPTLKIDSVAGVAAPANPTGSADITLPANTANPVTVVFKTTNVPVGNTVKLTLAPAAGAPTSVISPALTGTTADATASVSIALSAGPSVLQAQTTYTIVAALGDMMRNYAGNERVERIELVAGMNGKSTTNLITVSGKRYEATPEALAMLARMPAFMAQDS
jgi:hypothetical protein